MPRIAEAEACHIDIRIEGRGDVNIYNCCGGREHRGGRPSRDDAGPAPCRTEGACVPLGLGSKPKQTKRRKLEALRARSRVPSVLAASFFQTARRFDDGATAANDFERAVYPVFERMTPAVRDLLACVVENYGSTPADLRDAGLEPSLLVDPARPVDTERFGAALVAEITRRAADAVFGDPDALETPRPGLNRFFDPAGEESFESQLLICRVGDVRTAAFRPPLALADYQPNEIQQQCVPVQGPDGTITQNCSVLTANCPGNILPDGVCARVLDCAPGEALTISGLNFCNTAMKVRLRALIGTANAEVDAHVFGDLDTPRDEAVDGQTRLIRDCRVKDKLSFVVPADLPSGIYDLQLAMENNTGIASLGPTILSNIERINLTPPASARFQIVAERMAARAETAPASFGSDEVALTILAAPLLPDGSTGSLQRFDRRFDDVDSGESRTIEQVVFANAAEIAGVALSVVGYEVDSERAFREQIESFREAFLDYVTRAWEKFKEYLISGGKALIAKLGVIKGAIVLAIAAAVAAAIIAVVAYWAPADLIMDDAIGLSVIELAELANVGAPMGPIIRYDSPQGLRVTRTPLGKTALTYREFREYHSAEEESRYEVYLRYNQTA